MPVGRTRAVALLGLDGALVEVEADLSANLPSFVIIGLPDTSTSMFRRTRPSVPVTEYWTLFPHPKKYEMAWSSPVTGSTFGWAV